MIQNKIKAYAAVKYPGCHLVFTGNNSAVVIPEEGKMVRIECQSKRKPSWGRLVNWLIPAVMWLFGLLFSMAFIVEFLT